MIDHGQVWDSRYPNSGVDKLLEWERTPAMLCHLISPLPVKGSISHCWILGSRGLVGFWNNRMQTHSLIPHQAGGNCQHVHCGIANLFWGCPVGPDSSSERLICDFVVILLRTQHVLHSLVVVCVCAPLSSSRGSS